MLLLNGSDSSAWSRERPAESIITGVYIARTTVPQQDGIYGPTWSRERLTAQSFAGVPGLGYAVGQPPVLSWGRGSGDCNGRRMPDAGISGTASNNGSNGSSLYRQDSRHGWTYHDGTGNEGRTSSWGRNGADYNYDGMPNLGVGWSGRHNAAAGLDSGAAGFGFNDYDGMMTMPGSRQRGADFG